MPEVMYRVAREYDVVTVRVSDQGQERIDRLVPNRQCLATDCERKVGEKEHYTCGNCPTCYSAMLGIPESEREKLIRDGETLAPSKGGRRPKNKFTAKCARLKAARSRTKSRR